MLWLFMPVMWRRVTVCFERYRHAGCERVEKGAKRTPAGVEDSLRALAEPAHWPWLQPASAVPRVASDKIEAVEREVRMIRHGPPPPPPAQAANGNGSTS